MKGVDDDDGDWIVWWLKEHLKGIKCACYISTVDSSLEEDITTGGRKNEQHFACFKSTVMHRETVPFL